MGAEMETAEDHLEEGAQRGQTTLTEFFPTRFKGGQQSKGNTPQKHASTKQAVPATVDTACGSSMHSFAMAECRSTTRSLLPPSVNVGLSERIVRARAVNEPQLEDICCHQKASTRRSVGVSSCRGPPAENVGNVGIPRKVLHLGSAHEHDFTQLDPFDAIQAVDDAARAFANIVYMSRSYEPATPTSTSSTIVNNGEDEGEVCSAQSPAIAHASEQGSSVMGADELQCHEDMHLDSHSMSGDHYSNTSRASSSAAVARDVWSGVRSGAASIQGSPCAKTRRDLLCAGSERLDGPVLTSMHHVLEEQRGGAGAAAGEGVSEDEGGRKRPRTGSVGSGSSVGGESYDGEEPAWSTSSLSSATSRKRQQHTRHAHEYSVAGAPVTPPRPTTETHQRRQRGGFDLLNSRGFDFLNTRGGGLETLSSKGSPSRSGDVNPMTPPRASGMCFVSNGSGYAGYSLQASPPRAAAVSKRASKKTRVKIKHHVPTHHIFPSPERSCVAMPFSLLKPSSPGEQTLKAINLVVQQTCLRKQQHQLSSCSSSYSYSEGAMSGMGALGGVGGSMLMMASSPAIAEWPNTSMASVPPQTPPSSHHYPHEDAAMSSLLCDENLQDDSALYLSPRQEVQSRMLLLAPNSRTSLSTSSGVRSGGGMHMNITPFLSANPFQLSPNRCVSHLAVTPTQDLDVHLQHFAVSSP